MGKLAAIFLIAAGLFLVIANRQVTEMQINIYRRSGGGIFGWFPPLAFRLMCIVVGLGLILFNIVYLLGTPVDR